MSCGSVFLSASTPQPEDLYREAYFAPRPLSRVLTWIERLASRACFALRLRAAPPLEAGAKILDLGCGSGAWLAFLQERGFEVYGLDPSPAAVDAAQKRGLARVTLGFLDEGRLPEKTFDMITAIHCLEHVEHPRKFLREASRLLKPGGWLGVSIPNVASAEAERAQAAWYHLDPPYHRVLPTPSAMQTMLRACGLEEIRARCPSYDYPQAVWYALWRSPTMPFMSTLLALPFALLVNLMLASRLRAGVIDFWARRPSEPPFKTIPSRDRS